MPGVMPAAQLPQLARAGRCVFGPECLEICEWNGKTHPGAIFTSSRSPVLDRIALMEHGAHEGPRETCTTSNSSWVERDCELLAKGSSHCAALRARAGFAHPSPCRKVFGGGGRHPNGTRQLGHHKSQARFKATPPGVR